MTPQWGSAFILMFHLDDSCLQFAYIHAKLFCRNKKETRSYVEISQSLGVDKPSDILFVTDVFQEATAAKAAGMSFFLFFLQILTHNLF